MQQEIHAAEADRPCPLMFVILPTFVGGLIWLLALLARVGP
jgi:hypothetical protein